MKYLYIQRKYQASDNFRSAYPKELTPPPRAVHWVHRVDTRPSTAVTLFRSCQQGAPCSFNHCQQWRPRCCSPKQRCWQYHGSAEAKWGTNGRVHFQPSLFTCRFWRSYGDTMGPFEVVHQASSSSISLAPKKDLGQMHDLSLLSLPWPAFSSSSWPFAIAHGWHDPCVRRATLA